MMQFDISSIHYSFFLFHITEMKRIKSINTFKPPVTAAAVKDLL